MSDPQKLEFEAGRLFAEARSRRETPVKIFMIGTIVTIIATFLMLGLGAPKSWICGIATTATLFFVAFLYAAFGMLMAYAEANSMRIQSLQWQLYNSVYYIQSGEKPALPVKCGTDEEI
jgi:predicted lysophospholipase L1 biosynthesis ABC-type transport system permease subunit